MTTSDSEPKILSDAAQQLAWQLIQDAHDRGEPLHTGKSDYLQAMRKQYGDADAVQQEAAKVFDQSVEWFTEAAAS